MKKLTVAVLCSLLALSVSSIATGAEDRKTSSFFKYVKTMPDFRQLNPRLPNRGTQYCGPTAVSNALMWYAQNGFPDLIADHEDYDESQLQLIQSLGSDFYMNTNENTGTSPLGTMFGLERYVLDQGYDIDVEWKGWRNGGRYASRESVPSLQWLEEGIQEDSNMVISIGWYKYNRRSNSYQRMGGHYVTLVGMERRSNRPPTIYMHNPSFGNGQIPRPSTARLVPLRNGTFDAWSGYRSRSTRGYHEIQGISLPRDANIAILDGAVRFVVASPEQKESVITVSAQQGSETRQGF